MLCEQGDRPTLLSLDVPVGEGRVGLLDVRAAPGDPEENWLAHALPRLPARERLVLRLRYYHGLPQSDVAPIIGRSQMQVWRIKRAALAKLSEFASVAA